MPDLLPPNATQLEQDLSATQARISDLDVSDVSNLWDSDTCPVSLLPWLAWAVGVPEWSSQWSEAVQRLAIKNAKEVRRKRGTAGAVLLALQSLGLGVVLTEWFDQDPAGTPGTFQLEIDVTDRGLSEGEHLSIERAVNSTKNTRSHWDVLNIFLSASGPLNFAIAQQISDDSYIYPYSP